MPESTQHYYHFNIAEFEHWAQLASDDPEAFEVRRTRVIEEYINSVPLERQARLRGLQWRIDQIRRSSRTPLASCIRISRMMWDSVLGEGGLHDVLNVGLLGVTEAQPARVPRLSAQVLLFPDRRRRH